MSKGGKKTRIQTISQADLVAENLRAAKGLTLSLKAYEAFAKTKKGPGKHIVVRGLDDVDIEIYKIDVANGFKAVRDQLIKNASVRIKNTRAHQLGANQKSTTNFTKGIVYVGTALRNFVLKYGTRSQYDRISDGFSVSTEVSNILRSILDKYKNGGEYNLTKIDGISEFGLGKKGELVKPNRDNIPLLTVKYKRTKNSDSFVKGYGKYVNSQKEQKVKALESALKSYNEGASSKNRLGMKDVMLTEDEYNEVCAELAAGRYIDYGKDYDGDDTLSVAYNKMINMSIVFEKKKTGKKLTVEKFYNFTASFRGENVPNTEGNSFFESINNFPKTVRVENYIKTDFSKIKISEFINRMMWLDMLSGKKVESYENLPDRERILERMRAGVRARSRSSSPERRTPSASPPTRRRNEQLEQERESGSETEEEEEESVASPRAGGLAPRRRPRG